MGVIDIDVSFSVSSTFIGDVFEEINVVGDIVVYESFRLIGEMLFDCTQFTSPETKSSFSIRFSDEFSFSIS